MKKQHILLLVAVLIIIGIFFLFNSSDDDAVVQEPSATTTQTIQSSDSSAVLEIPEGSLPDGVSVDDITVVRAKNVPGIPESFTAYDLGPSGTVFNKDIFLDVDLKNNTDGSVPRAFYLTENGEMESVKNYDVIINTDMGETEVKLALAHFSRVIITADVTEGGLTRTEHFGARASVPDTFVGQVVSGSLTLTMSKEPVPSWTSDSGSQIGAEVLDGTLLINGILQGSANLSPTGTIFNRPPSTLIERDTYTIPLKDHTCTTKGEASITSEINLLFSERDRYRDDENSPWDDRYIEDNPVQDNRGVKLTIVMPFLCIDPPKEEGSSSTEMDESETKPAIKVGSNVEKVYVVVYTVDGQPYAQAQFQSMTGHDGCPLHHAHSNTTIYPFESWIVRGSNELKTGGNVALTDPAPERCGYGVTNTLGPKSVFVPLHYFQKACGFFQFDQIKHTTDYDIKSLAGLKELCEKWSF